MAFQASGKAAPGGFARARRWIEEGKGLPVIGETGAGACRAVKFGRLHAESSLLATSERGWLAAAGTWDHPSTKGDGDTAGLLALVEARGAEALDGLDGLYVVCWHDAREGGLTVATDFFGRLHAFLAESDEGVFVSTSPVALAAAAPGDLDPEAVYEFLAGGTLYEERTPFLRVRRLLAGRRYHFEEGRLKATRTVPLMPVGRPGESVATTVDRLLEVYDGSLTRSLGAHKKLLPDLTGGVDSRVVVGLLQRTGHDFEVTVTGAADDPDVTVAARLASRTGLHLLPEPVELMASAQSSLETVLKAAARSECDYDAVEYAGIAAVHDKHSRTHDASVNGSGGEVFRNYWWNAGNFDRAGGGAAEALRRFTGTTLAPTFLASEHLRDPERHYGAALARCAAARADDPFHTQLDHVYLDLRMQCWQGAIASATNQFWPTISPLLWAGPLRVLFAADPRHRLGGKLLFELLGRFPAPYTACPLATGFPPRTPGLLSAWRFLPGLCRLPFDLLRRVRARLGIAPRDEHGAELARALFRSGAGDYLEPGQMKLLPLLDRPRYERFLEQAREGKAPLPLLGRLLALEFSLRAGS